MFMIIRESSAGGGDAGAMSVPQERTAKQVQAAIKKKVEKRRKQSDEQRGGAADIQTSTPQPPRLHRAAHIGLRTTTAAEDRLEETLEEMMEGPQRRDRESEKGEGPVDLLPIVDSVFGQ
ncbi:unnamed protein product, partial [Lampetra planeri]